jgi:hypothetical protein
MKHNHRIPARIRTLGAIVGILASRATLYSSPPTYMSCETGKRKTHNS